MEINKREGFKPQNLYSLLRQSTVTQYSIARYEKHQQRGTAAYSRLSMLRHTNVSGITMHTMELIIKYTKEKKISAISVFYCGLYRVEQTGRE